VFYIADGPSRKILGSAGVGAQYKYSRGHTYIQNKFDTFAFLLYSVIFITVSYYNYFHIIQTHSISLNLNK